MGVGRWRGVAGRVEAGVADMHGLHRQAAAAARSSPRAWPRRSYSGAGLTFLFSKNVDSEKHPERLNLEDQTQEEVVKHIREVL